MQFVRFNKCTEGPLQVAMEKAYDGLVYQRMLNRLALGFVSSAFTIQAIVGLFFTDLKYMLYLCCCANNKKYDFEVIKEENQMKKDEMK